MWTAFGAIAGTVITSLWNAYQRSLDRKAALRQDVYVEGIAALQRSIGLFSSLVDADLDEAEFNQKKSEIDASIHQLLLVTDRKSFDHLIRFNDEFAVKLTAARLDRRPLAVIRQSIKDNISEIKASESERVQAVDSLKSLPDIPSAASAKMEVAATLNRLLRETNERAAKLKALGVQYNKAMFEYASKLGEQILMLEPKVMETLSELRHDLGLSKVTVEQWAFLKQKDVEAAARFNRDVSQITEQNAPEKL